MSVLHTLFPKGRAELLKQLFRPPFKEVHLRELTRQSGLSIRAIQKEITTLHGIDIVTVRKDGNRSYIRANTEHPCFNELSAFVLKLDGLQEALAAALEKVEGVEVAFLFGSVAKGLEKAHSDVDLIVIGKVGLRTLAPILRPISQRFGREINAHVLTAESWSEKMAEGDAFVCKVANEKRLFVKGNANEFKTMGHQWLAKAAQN